MKPQTLSGTAEAGVLIMQIANGDRAALRALYVAEAPRMLGIALRILRRRSTADEAVHDAFLRVWEKASQFSPQFGNGQGWLNTLVRRVALNILRGEARTDLTADLEPLHLESPEESPEEVMVKLSSAAALHRCLGTLPADRRAAVLLAYVQGLSHGELAERLKLPLGTVKAWIRRSLLALKECLR